MVCIHLAAILTLTVLLVVNVHGFHVKPTTVVLRRFPAAAVKQPSLSSILLNSPTHRASLALRSTAAVSINEVENERSTSVISVAQRFFAMLRDFSQSKVFRFVLLPILCISAAIYFFPATASAAANASKQPVKKKGKRKILKILNKLFFSKKATVAGVTRAGDQLQAQSGYALYMARVLGLLTILGTTAATLARARRFRETRALREAVDRELEYRENMFFDAVEEITKKLNNPKLKGSVRADLTKQLKELDPEGTIQAFLRGQGERPDLSDRIDASRIKRKEKQRMERIKNRRRKRKDLTALEQAMEDEQQEDEYKYTDEDDEEEKEEEPPRAPRSWGRGPTPKQPKSWGNKPAPKNPSNDKKKDERRSLWGGESSEDNKSPPPPHESSKPRSWGAGPGGKRLKSEEVLNQLDHALDMYLPPDQRDKVLMYVRDRIEAIPNADKLQKALLKISEKLDDGSYWQSYASQL